MATSIDQVRRQVEERFSDPDNDVFVFVRDMFTDRAILELPDGTLQEVEWSLSDDEELSLGEPREVTLEYVAKSEGGPRLTGPIVGKDEQKQIGYSAVLVPGEPDSDGETLTAEKIEDVAHTWLADFRAFDVQHSVNKVDAAPVESYLEPADRVVQLDGGDVVLPRGTWTVAVKVHDADVWADMVSGKRAGLSIMGVPAAQREAALAAVKAGQLEMIRPAFKRVTLADVGGGDPNGDWFAPFIGIVDRPAVPKAKFYALKRRRGPEPEPEPWWRRWFAPKQSALGDRLRGVRDAMELSTGDLAVAAGISESSAKSILRGQAPDVAELEGLATALELDLGELIGLAEQDGHSYI
ncbi:MAG: XkdF-like putative serine protease domain-containing protein [bacterium]